jgi:hypothetical protein
MALGRMFQLHRSCEPDRVTFCDEKRSEVMCADRNGQGWCL